MDRTAFIRTSGPRVGLIVSTALASAVLAGCTTAGAPPAATSFSKAQVALEKGDSVKAISHAEAAVLAEPRNPAFRAMLGAAYLENGRFESAKTSFGDALSLGHDDPRTVLSFALASIATGDSKTAVATLREWENAIPGDDLGLAYALAGQPERGVHVLTNAVRAGLATPKARQNLAYTYALAGNWRAARVMAAEDVPADQLDARLSEWAAMAAPENYRERVASLLRVTPVADSGLPAMLALANFPSQEQMVAEAAATIPAAEKRTEASESEKAAFATTGEERLEKVDPTPVRVAAAEPVKETKAKPEIKPRPEAKPAPRVSEKVSAAAVDAESSAKTATVKDEAAPAKPAPAAKPAAEPAARVAAASGPRFVSNPVVQSAPASKPAAKPAPTRVAAKSSQARMAATEAASQPAPAKKPGADTHLVQLGSWASHDMAKEGWVKLKRKFPQLKDHDVVITEALVNGKTYFRVAAAGFGLSDARSMCRTVKSGGGGCFAYAKTNPPAGAVDRGVRIAARTK
ncbi:tetratricopeptide repeat protein [Erythrobacter sp.]|uniref:tetratricopeptide repeat protein n=1 Tax=Erythrobacter sp. TaxID=1042 RepID=UPI001425D681|nr:tetratricopeptide repeat protein [Erythrobacter sp.]QIQ86949.1 MAG: tetratricopeptide repeat protein [Erythrobacter sp.]